MTTTPLDWRAAMISPTVDDGSAPTFTRRFALDPGHGQVRSAVLHASALGVFEASLNGSPVGPDVLSPGWTSFEWRLRYRTYDVTHLLAGSRTGSRTDENELAATVGRGWWAGRLGWDDQEPYGDRIGLLAQLEITFEDGHRQTVVTDEGWTARPSDVVADDLYDGQVIDARRRHQPQPELAVEVLPFDHGILVPYIGPPVVRHETVAPVSIWTSPSGRTLVDFGQNLVGWIRLRAQGPAGTEVVVRHAEVLEDGELGVRTLRAAEATDRFVLSGEPDEFEPTFTFHGFRYAEVTGHPGELTPDDLEAVVVHSELARTGFFECSDPLVTQLHRNVVWGWRGNALDLPTDCPQRDERMGWTGDISVFAPTAAYLYDVKGFLADWLADLAVEQRNQDGMVPFVVPDLLKRAMRTTPPPIPIESTAIWGDAAVWVPWALWQAYGDPDLLADHLPSMVAHLRRVAGLVSDTGLWDRGFQFGDWLDPSAPPEAPHKAKAAREVVATACLHRSARLTAEAATVLGEDDVASEMTALADRTRRAFLDHYVDADGRVHSDAPTVYALAIVFGLVDGEGARAAGDRLAELVAADGFRISTGFAGTPFICDALTATGHLDHAYRLLLERECPSWLYPVTMGATTVWERWDAMLPDGSINPGEMTSFNHYALGAVADWLHRTVGGLAPATPGYATVRIAPRPGGGLTWARTHLTVANGRIGVEWRIDGGDLVVEVELPAGATGVLDLPGAAVVDLEPGRHEHRVPFATPA